MRYLRKSTDVVAYAWNADTVCVPCTQAGLIYLLGVSGRISGGTRAKLFDLSLEELSEAYARIVLGRSGPLSELDTNEFPQPMFADQDGVDQDSCGRCLMKIKDTL